MCPARQQPLRENGGVEGAEQRKVLTTANCELEERKKEATPPMVERGVGSSPVPPVKQKSPKRERRTLRSRAGNVKRDRTEESKEEGEGSRTPEAVENNPANGTKPKRPAKGRKVPEGELCAVCSDLATGCHYGVASCNGCKTFFRRTIVSDHTFICQYQGNCDVNKNNRCACRHCRFNKCVAVGMDAKGVAKGDVSEGSREAAEGSDEEVYEVEYIAAVRESEEGRRYFVKWKGWSHSTSTWESESKFEEMRLCMREFAERNRLLSVVIRNPRERSMPAREEQLESIMKWEDDMNEVLKQAGRQTLMVYNDVDEVMARTNFQYILSSKYPQELVDFWKGVGSSVACSCKDECAEGTKCCPSEEDSKHYYTKRGCVNREYVKDSQDASRILVECNDDCSCGPSCPTRVVQKGRRAKVVLVRTEGCGWGVVALDDIQANAFVVEYVGEVITAKEAVARKDTMYQYDLDANGTAKYVIDSKYYGNEAAFINHSCEPNLRAYCVHIERVDSALYHIGLFSTRRIKRGEQLTLNYFQGQDEREHTGKKCMCGTASCMKFWPTSSRK